MRCMRRDRYELCSANALFALRVAEVPTFAALAAFRRAAAKLSSALAALCAAKAACAFARCSLS